MIGERALIDYDARRLRGAHQHPLSIPMTAGPRRVITKKCAEAKS